MMSAPLILSSDLTRVTQSPAMLAILGSDAVIAIDQDPLGEAATVVRSDATLDVLVKRLANGDRAIAIFNHGEAATAFQESIDTLGFGACPSCSYVIEDLWTSARPAVISGTLTAHAAALFRVRQAR